MHIKFISILSYFLFTTSVTSAQPLKDRDSTPHFSECYTQGLIIQNNMVWESCGGFGESHLMQWDLKTQKVLKKISFDDKYFAEGLTELNGKLYMLTWRSELAFKIDKETFKTLKTYKYKGEGWGLTNDGAELIMSNGSDKIQFINPKDFSVTRSLKVTINNEPVNRINELEWIDGKIYANIFQSDYIVAINPQTGIISNKYYLPDLLKNSFRKPGVLNGIAHDKATGKTWVTGKNWPKMFELKK